MERRDRFGESHGIGVSMGRQTSITQDMIRQRFLTEMTEHQDKQLMLLKRNRTAGMAEEAI